MSKKKLDTEEPRVSIVATDSVTLKIPGTYAGSSLSYYGARFTQGATPSMEDLRRFVRTVEDRFGSFTDASLSISETGITAREVEVL